MTTDNNSTFQVGSEYIYSGLVTGPYKVHKTIVSLTYHGNYFSGHLRQDGEDVNFKVNILESTQNKMKLKSELFALPSSSELSNLEMICQAEITDSKLVGSIEIPMFSVMLSLNLDRLL